VERAGERLEVVALFEPVLRWQKRVARLVVA
jgi:hypothetical protein